MAKMAKLEVLAEFGYSRNPFKNFTIKSEDHLRISRVAGLAVSDNAMVSIIGERGIGKSNAVRAALRKSKDIRIVSPYSNDINKLNINDIEQALILDLSHEKPKRGKEIRARQLRRILGEASTRMNIVLVIEEAHYLHGMTLRALKRIREMEWMGKSGLFSVILICQSDPMNKPGVSEVRLRSDALYMNGLSQPEIIKFVNRAIGSIIDKKATEAISKLPGSHNYEDLKATLHQLLETALLAGRKKITIDDVERVFGGGSLEDLRKEVDMSKTDLAKESGLSQPTVSKLLKTEDNGHVKPATKKKMDGLRSILESHQKNNGEDSQQVAMG